MLYYTIENLITEGSLMSLKQATDVSNTNTELTLVFKELRSMMSKYKDYGVITEDSDEIFQQDCNNKAHNGHTYPLVIINTRKRYVSIHIFGVYVYPELLITISDALQKRKHGLQCFNFKKIDRDLFIELDSFIVASLELYKEDGLIT